MQTELDQLKNLGNTTVHWLNTIGVHNLSDLKEKSAVGAYVEIKRRGIRASKVLLYALHGAITDTSWKELNQDTKERLVAEAEEYLHPANSA